MHPDVLGAPQDAVSLPKAVLVDEAHGPHVSGLAGGPKAHSQRRVPHGLKGVPEVDNGKAAAKRLLDLCLGDVGLQELPGPREARADRVVVVHVHHRPAEKRRGPGICALDARIDLPLQLLRVPKNVVEDHYFVRACRSRQVPCHLRVDPGADVRRVCKGGNDGRIEADKLEAGSVQCQGLADGPPVACKHRRALLAATLRPCVDDGGGRARQGLQVANRG
mmetsp:Transcript_119116/g.384628  ORF Transcript_119116/g.384628 Transcript_119116/m.384628 type:complete len:221 (+) Transcript_119116:478-1140(+)